MQFTPLTPEQAAKPPTHERKLRPIGEYNFTIMSAVESVSKKGNDMITLKLEVFDHDGTSFVMTDYIVATAEYKLRHFAYSIGLGNEYESGKLDTLVMDGRSGTLKLGIEKGKPDDKGGVWPDKNAVKDYVPADEHPKADCKPTAVNVTPSEDEPPF